MIEIELPCCGEMVVTEMTLSAPVACEGCGIVLVVAADERPGAEEVERPAAA